MTRVWGSAMLIAICLLAAISVSAADTLTVDPPPTSIPNIAHEGSLEQRVERLEKLVERLIKRSDEEPLLPESPQSSRSRDRDKVTKIEYERLLQLYLELGSLRQLYGANHPKVKAIEQQIATIDEFLRANSRNTVERTKAKLTRALEETQAEFARRQDELKVLQDRMRDLKRQIAEFDDR